MHKSLVYLFLAPFICHSIILYIIPVCFTASSAQKSTTKKPEKRQQPTDLSVDVTRIRSRSKGQGDIEPKRSTGYQGDNPMEQPQFGAPSEKSYYVSSSQFTSRDVEEIKRHSLQKSSVSWSECSSSSHISCPDPANMNVSPAAYVEKLFDGSPTSDLSSDVSDANKRRGKRGISRTSSEHSKMTEDEFKGADSQVFSLDYDAPLDDIDVEIEVKADITRGAERHKEVRDGNGELEESWEEFYKSPLEKRAADIDHRKIQRLESINRDMREEAILRNFEESESSNAISSPDMTQSSQTVVPDNTTSQDISENSSYIGFDLDPDSESVKDTSENVDGLTQGTNELLDVSQKLLLELGIEDKEDIQETKKLSHIEEKVKLETDDEATEVVLANPKKKKIKSSSSLDKLKPSLSPKSEGIGPELSNAVADKVEQIRTLENPDYLRKHRMSLPVTGTSKSGTKKRQSVPSVGGMDNARKLSPSPYSIGEGISGDDITQDTEGEKDDSKSRTRSTDDIDPDEDEAFHRYELYSDNGSDRELST